MTLGVVQDAIGDLASLVCKEVIYLNQPYASSPCASPRGGGSPPPPTADSRHHPGDEQRHYTNATHTAILGTQGTGTDREMIFFFYILTTRDSINCPFKTKCRLWYAHAQLSCVTEKKNSSKLFVLRKTVMCYGCSRRSCTTCRWHTYSCVCLLYVCLASIFIHTQLLLPPRPTTPRVRASGAMTGTLCLGR